MLQSTFEPGEDTQAKYAIQRCAWGISVSGGACVRVCKPFNSISQFCTAQQKGVESPYLSFINPGEWLSIRAST